MSRPAEQTSHRRLFFALAALNLLAAFWVVWDETSTRRPWKGYQHDFNRLLDDRGLGAEPIRIRQVTNPELGVVDRCSSCHLGIDRADVEDDDVPPVFRSHPRRAELLAKHPVARYGCTICHQGQGAQTKGVGWRDFDHGRDDPYWDTPMPAPVFAESACATCHAVDGRIAGADTFERGRALFVERRCFGCHEARFVDPGFEAAPPLDHIAAKTAPGVLAAWLRDPAAFRPATAMPTFWPEPLSADGTPLSADDPARAAWQSARDADIAAILAYLSSLPFALSVAPARSAGAESKGQDTDRGRALFDTVGCRGCHALGPSTTPPQPTFAPDLSRIGEKASSRWLDAWLTDPAALWPRTRMPDPRLTADERAALVADLVTLRRPDAAPAPPTPTWPAPDPALAAAGRRTIQRLGCAGCHAIPGIELTGKPGPDLTTFGDKTPDLLTWGTARVDCDGPTLPCWTQAKLEHPRWPGGGRLALTMPSARLDAADARALAVFVLAQRGRVVPPAYRHVPDERRRALDRGEALLARHNCRGCHAIDGRGGDIARFYGQVWEAPPPLTGAGRKLDYRWLFAFLDQPSSVRPWLVARMPRFRLPADERDDLVRYFAVAAGQPYPFPADPEPRLTAEDRPAAQAMFRDFQCTRCHELSTATSLQPGELAPDLAQVRRRLRPGWVRAWLLDPQALLEGTRMPSYFPVEDEDQPDVHSTPCPACFGGDVARQIEALLGVLWEL